MRNCLISIIFFVLIVFFILSVSVIFLDSARYLVGDMFLPIFVIFSFLGIFLAFLVSKSRINRKKKKFLLLSGISAFLLLFSILLHNAFYALEILTENVFFFEYLMRVLNVFFFFSSIVIFPLLFLIGSLGAIFFSLKRK
jgi:hypothetical protein